MTSAQLQIDWDYFQHRSWIQNAAIVDGHADDGSLVKADKQQSLLLRLNDHFGDNVECWPSQERLAKLMKVSTKTVRRASEALQNKSLLIVRLKNRPGKKTVVNHYTIVWSELLLLDPDRKRAFMASIAADQSDMVTDQSDMVTDQSDMVTDQSDIVSPELLTNYSQNYPENSPLPKTPDRSRRRTPPSQAPELAAGWQVVASALIDLDMSAHRGAITAAKRRELTPTDVLELIQRYKQFAPTEPKATVGWLYRWITGASNPPPADNVAERVEHCEARAKFKNRQNAELILCRVAREGRQRGKTDEQIRNDLAQSLQRAGLPADAVTF